MFCAGGRKENGADEHGPPAPEQNRDYGISQVAVTRETIPLSTP
jgi:hypothetical protein